MKKMLFLFSLLLVTLFGCTCEHEWTNATCVAPSECSVCGEISGSADPLAHQFGEWEPKTPATCTESGEQRAVCTLCEEEKTSPLPKTDHVPGEWEITKQATLTESGTRVLLCSVCGAALQPESFQLSEEEAQALRAKQAEEQAAKQTQTQSQSVSSAPQKTNSRTVYRTPSGKRYHLSASCGGKNSYETTLDDATAVGLTPCKKCAQ